MSGRESQGRFLPPGSVLLGFRIELDSSVFTKMARFKQCPLPWRRRLGFDWVGSVKDLQWLLPRRVALFFRSLTSNP